MYGGVRPVYSSPVDHVLGIGGPPPGHAQLLHQLPHLLLRLCPLQKGTPQGDKDKDVDCSMIRCIRSMRISTTHY